MATLYARIPFEISFQNSCLMWWTIVMNEEVYVRLRKEIDVKIVFL